MALYKRGVTRGRRVEHGHGGGRDPVAVGGQVGRVDQDGAGGGGQVAATVHGVVPGRRLAGLHPRGLRLVRG